MKIDLQSRLYNSAFAFRGYNVVNLGRTPELLEVPKYAPVMERYLDAASETCSDMVGRTVDLVARARRREETTLDTYDEAICLIVATEQAQLAILREQFGMDFGDAKLVFGYSLGEISAAVATGVFTMDEALRIPLAMATDAVALARDVTLGILFSRGKKLPVDEIKRLCIQINSEGKGVIGVSTYLSPNSLLLLGQGNTIELFRSRMRDEFSIRTYLRINKNRWPPMHTPIVWEANLSNRAASMMHTMSSGFTEPRPPILSLVTGEASYNDFNARDIMNRWTDHPQLLWDVVTGVLAAGVQTLVHVGPAPNIIPATFRRLAENVEAQVEGKLHMRALTSIVERPWLSSLLPSTTVLLRAPGIEQIILEDWLLEEAGVAPEESGKP